ncbi:hypothetical protein [Kordia sp.]|uniref:hypothetical protein n=1 Tax=Kordia sp. TaxID=1965332 RepID=UPI003B5B38E1
MAGSTDPIIGIENWSALAKDAPIDGIISLFQNSGNSFSLTLDETLKQSKILHVYFMLDSAGKIEFFVIPAASDVKGKSVFSSNLPISQLGASKTTINNDNNNELITWIDNWCNQTLRDAWLMKVTQAAQVLVIHTSDFTVNDNHECYLALKPNTNPNINNQYALDLVVQNTSTGNYLNAMVQSPEGTIGYADMARPVPPYDNGVNSDTAESDFGILESL